MDQGAPSFRMIHDTLTWAYIHEVCFISYCTVVLQQFSTSILTPMHPLSLFPARLRLCRPRQMQPAHSFVQIICLTKHASTETRCSQYVVRWGTLNCACFKTSKNTLPEPTLVVDIYKNVLSVKVARTVEDWFRTSSLDWSTSTGDTYTRKVMISYSCLWRFRGIFLPLAGRCTTTFKLLGSHYASITKDFTALHPMIWSEKLWSLTASHYTIPTTRHIADLSEANLGLAFMGTIPSFLSLGSPSHRDRYTEKTFSEPPP